MIADIIAEDRGGNPIVMVDIKVTVASREDILSFLSRFLEVVPPLNFAMFVDLEYIAVMKSGVDNPQTPLVTLKTLEVLQFYDPEFAGKNSSYGSRRIFHDYVRTLVEAWLRDLAYHWKSETPPGAKELSGTGLLELLEGGMTRSDVTIVVSPLH
jgi:hypothetical protein